MGDCDWSELPDGVIWKISRRLELYEDFAAFRGVCKSWQQGATKMDFKHDSPGNIPWLMLAPSKRNEVQQFYSLPKQKIVRRVSLPEIKERRVFSSQGWLITMGNKLALHLLHPFTRVQIKLPSPKPLITCTLDTTGVMKWDFVSRVALSSPPSSSQDEGCTIVIIYGGLSKLAFCKLGDVGWTRIGVDNGFTDITYHQSKFYAVSGAGRVFACSFNPGQKYEIYQVGDLAYNLAHWYLVGCTKSSLFLVASDGDYEQASARESYHKSSSTFHMIDFEVVEMDTSSGKWAKVYSLGNKTIFLGNSCTLLASHDNSTTVNPNCIYFTDDPVSAFVCTRQGGDTNVGIYNIDEKKMISNLSGKPSGHSNPPMWILPSYQI